MNHAQGLSVKEVKFLLLSNHTSLYELPLPLKYGPLPNHDGSRFIAHTGNLLVFYNS